MMKKIINILFIFSLILFCLPALASDSADYVNHQAPSGLYYRQAFDVLVMDITIPDNNGKSDSLSALTVKDTGSATILGHIDNLVLWADDGPIGFQGEGTDRKIRETDNFSNGGLWTFSDMILQVPVGGLRVFVSADLSFSINKDSYIKMQIPVLTDNDADGEFDYGEQGIFMHSLNNGPVDEAIDNARQQNIDDSAQDLIAPKSKITNLTDGQELTDDYLLLEGWVRDAGGSSPQWIQVGINGEYHLAEIYDRVDEFYFWEYEWDNILPGEYTVTSKSKDWFGNEEIVLEEFDVTFAEPVSVDVDSSVFSVSRGEVKADGQDFAILQMQVLDSDGQPAPNSQVTVLSDQTWIMGKTYSDISDENGLVKYLIQSQTVGTVTFSALINSVEYPISLSVDFTNEEMDSWLDFSQGSWIKTADMTAVYFLDQYNIRHAYPNQKIWYSHHGNDFSFVDIVSNDEMAGYSLGENVTFKHGTLMKIPSVPKVYVVDGFGGIDWIKDEQTAQFIYGDNWADLIYDLSESFFPDYTEGSVIEF